MFYFLDQTRGVILLVDGFVLVGYLFLELTTITSFLQFGNVDPKWFRTKEVKILLL